MPESLIFCTGATVGVQGGGDVDNHSDGSLPDCSTATAGAVSFNAEFSPAATAYATSMMAASTNAGTGYSITLHGATLTSGSNTIPAMATGVSTLNVSQFGLNLRLNTTPVVDEI